MPDRQSQVEGHREAEEVQWDPYTYLSGCVHRPVLFEVLRSCGDPVHRVAATSENACLKDIEDWDVAGDKDAVVQQHLSD